MSLELLQDWQWDIKSYKVGCKNCVKGLEVANASSQTGNPSSIPPGGETIFNSLVELVFKSSNSSVGVGNGIVYRGDKFNHGGF